MKALIRGDEIIIEPFDKWIEDHLEWLTTARPNGDGYKIVELPEETSFRVHQSYL